MKIKINIFINLDIIQICIFSSGFQVKIYKYFNQRNSKMS